MLRNKSNNGNDSNDVNCIKLQKTLHSKLPPLNNINVCFCWLKFSKNRTAWNGEYSCDFPIECLKQYAYTLSMLFLYKLRHTFHFVWRKNDKRMKNIRHCVINNSNLQQCRTLGHWSNMNINFLNDLRTKVFFRWNVEKDQRRFEQL